MSRLMKIKLLLVNSMFENNQSKALIIVLQSKLLDLLNCNLCDDFSLETYFGTNQWLKALGKAKRRFHVAYGVA